MSGQAVSAAGSWLSLKEFKLYAVETGQWLWGTVQGAFNEKMSLSQIITDAVIGMIPLVGDVTAARDIIAISSGLATEQKKRDDTMQWVLLVIFIFALIPVFGGVIKGVGRIAVRLGDDVVKAVGQAAHHSDEIAKLANEIIAFLNRMGHKNAEAWFKALNVLSYQAQILGKFRHLCDTLVLSINRYVLRFQSVLPQSLIARCEQLVAGFKQIKALGESKMPLALKELHGKLERLQKMIHSGGVPPVNKTKTIVAQTGQKTVTYVEEARLLERGAAKRVAKGGKHPQNLASADPKHKHAIDKIYKYEDGFPNLTRAVVTDTETGVKYFSAIAAANGPIKNELLSGETLFRSFGPKGKTHGVDVAKSTPIGMWWGRGAPPKSAEAWRGPFAVLDEFNRNGWLSVIHIPPGTKLPACTSTVSEQYGKKIAGQFLEGGGKQAAIDKLFDAKVQAVADRLAAIGGGKATLQVSLDGVLKDIAIEVKQSGWSNTNGKFGYFDTIIPGASMTERLGITEIQSKIATQSAQGTAKHERKQ
jgi:hypothetical protein